MLDASQKVLINTALILLAAGCLSIRPTPSPEQSLTGYEVTEFAADSQFGCTYSYRVFAPTTRRYTTTILLGHGFLRGQKNMRGLSQALAGQGIRVITLDFCNMRLWNGHHRRNASDMQALAKQLGVQNDVIYGGFSAGALAAILAADENTYAILALDLVDQDQLGEQHIRSLNTPLIGIAGPPSACNAFNNGHRVFRARSDTSESRSQLLTVDSASHCEFESPSDWLCELTCGDKGDSDNDASERQAIIQTVTDLMVSHFDSDTVQGAL